MLEPVRGVSEGVEFGGVTIREAVVSHFREEEGVAFAPKDAPINRAGIMITAQTIMFLNVVDMPPVPTTAESSIV